MKTSILKNYYDVRGPSYGMNKLRHAKILRLLEGVELGHKRILDLGCAAGYFGKELKKPGNFVAGIDISDVVIAEAKKNLDAAYVVDIENEDWPQDFIQQPFDIIICAEIIEHLFDQDAFLQKLKKILKPNGSVIITTPNFLLWNNRVRMLFGQFGMKEVLYDQSHIHLMSYRGLHEKITKNNFRVVREENIWYPNYLERWKNFLPPNLFVFQTIAKLELCP